VGRPRRIVKHAHAVNTTENDDISIDHWVIVAADLQRTLSFYEVRLRDRLEKRPGRPDMATIRIGTRRRSTSTGPGAGAPGYPAPAATAGGADLSRMGRASTKLSACCRSSASSPKRGV
jgi:hypothetical protein